MAAAPRGSLARALKRAALALAATTVALLAAEGLVRAFGDVPGVKPIWFSRDDSIYRRSQNPVLSFELEPGYHNPNPDLIRTYERVNSHGQRDPERALAKPAGVNRVLLLGDSVVEGHGVREIDTISQQLERLLGTGFEVLNFGVSGYCTKAEIELLATKGLAFAPDQVVLLFVGNDFNDFNAETFELGGSLHQPMWARRLFVGSELFRMLCLRLDWFGFVAQVDPVAWNQAAIGDNNVVEGLDRLRALAQEKGFGVLLAIWPEFGPDKVIDLFYMPGQAGAGELVIERLAWERGFPTVRLSRAFQGLAGSGASPSARFTVGDGMHPSAEGCRVAAETLAAVIRDPSGAELHTPQATGARPEELARELGAHTTDYSSVWNEKGVAALAAGDMATAVQHFHQALQEDPASQTALFNLGFVAYQQSDFAAAEAWLVKSLAVKPRDADALEILGVSLAQQGRLDEARTRLEEAASIEPARESIRANLAEVERRRRGGG